MVLIIHSSLEEFIMYQILCSKGHGEKAGKWHAAVHGVIKTELSN